MHLKHRQHLQTSSPNATPGFCNTHRKVSQPRALQACSALPSADTRTYISYFQAMLLLRVAIITFLADKTAIGTFSVRVHSA
jgi:hypothetical protein